MAIRDFLTSRPGSRKSASRRRRESRRSDFSRKMKRQLKHEALEQRVLLYSSPVHPVFAEGTPQEYIDSFVDSLMETQGVVPDGAQGFQVDPPNFSWSPNQGDPVVLSVFWQNEAGKWVERPYEYFVSEAVAVAGLDKPIEKPWTPHFVCHGSGAIHTSGTGCIACPCDCPGGIIADNRFPIYDPKPMVKFEMAKAPPEGTQVYVRIRVISTRAD